MTAIISKEEVYRLNISFTVVFIILLTILFFILIQIFKNENYKINNILSLECAVLFIASFFYYEFIKLTSLENINNFDYKKIINYRYIDWSLTTPILLLALLLFIQYFNNKLVNFWHYLIVFILNYVMLYFGYLGENGKMDKMIALFIGFIAFIIMFLFIYFKFIINNKSSIINILFIVFIIIWGSYGLIYLLKDETKNHWYNHQDIIAKGLFSTFITFYFFKFFTF
jgi:bacteriorhodopsin